jgi:ribosomal protein L28
MRATFRNSNIKTHRWQHVNVQRRRLYVARLGGHVTLSIAASDLGTIEDRPRRVHQAARRPALTRITP